MKNNSNKVLVQLDKNVHRQLLILKSIKEYKSISDTIEFCLSKVKLTDELS